MDYVMVNRLIAAIVFVCMAFVSCRTEDNGENMQEYETMKVYRQMYDLSESYTASIRGCQDVDIYPQISGTLTRVCIREGQRVRRGEILFVIDRVPYQMALRMAKANVRAAKARVEKAKREFESKKLLYKENIVSDFELATARNDLALVEAELDQMAAQELEALNNLSYTEIRSPVNGVVGTLPFRVGSLVGPSMNLPLTTVSDNALMHVYFSMNENNWRNLIKENVTAEEAIRRLPEVKLRLNDGSIYKHPGKIVAVSGIVNQQTGSVSLRCEFPNNNGELLSGSAGSVILPDRKNNVIVIPQKAVNELQNKKFAYIVEHRGSSHFVKAVEITVDDKTDGKNYVVRSGLIDGDIIISNGVGLLRDGMEIKIAERKNLKK